eukprot:3288941-Rhodomonas_salina.1
MGSRDELESRGGHTFTYRSAIYRGLKLPHTGGQRASWTAKNTFLLGIPTNSTKIRRAFSSVLGFAIP